MNAEVRWRLRTSENEYNDLNLAFVPKEHVVAYAACWVHSDEKRTVSLAVGNDDNCKVWLNRKLVLTGKPRTWPSAGEFVERVELAAGWNEVLVKVSQSTGQWGFHFELMDEMACKGVEGVKVADTPPKP